MPPSIHCIWERAFFLFGGKAEVGAKAFFASTIFPIEKKSFH
jgi:hypothetical protein